MGLWVVAAAVAVVLSFVLFEYVTDYFVDGIGNIGRVFDVPDAVLGASVAAVGSSLPELFTSLSSMLIDHPAIGLGTIVGSAVFNITVIIAAAGWVRECEIDPHVLFRDMVVYAAVVLVMGIAIYDGTVSRLEAVVWLASYGLYFWWLVRDARRGEYVPQEDVPTLSHARAAGYLVVGLVGISVLSHILVESSLVITDFFGLRESVFALIVIAAGTSVPDTFTSVTAARKGMGSMAVTNAVGSNIFDILVGLGLPLSILARSTAVEGNVITSVGVLFGSVVLAGALLKWGNSITRRDGVVLTVFYIVFVGLLVAGVI
ncbi:MAG: calcium/sodium antiporter [Halococcoides sp.]